MRYLIFLLLCSLGWAQPTVLGSNPPPDKRTAFELGLVTLPPSLRFEAWQPMDCDALAQPLSEEWLQNLTEAQKQNWAWWATHRNGLLFMSYFSIPKPALTLTAGGMWQPSSLVISCGEGRIRISMKTGEVTFEDCELDEAARTFWFKVSAAWPYFRTAVIEFHEEEQRNKRFRVVGTKEWDHD